MGLAALGRFVVMLPVHSFLFQRNPSSSLLTRRIHRGRANSICKDQAKLLLRFGELLFSLLGYGILLLPVS